MTQPQAEPVVRRPFLPIARAVAEYFGSRLDELRERSTRRIIARPRQVAMYAGYVWAGQSLSHIGRMLGGRHHSTVRHGVITIAALAKRDPVLAADLATLRAEVGA